MWSILWKSLFDFSPICMAIPIVNGFGCTRSPPVRDRPLDTYPQEKHQLITYKVTKQEEKADQYVSGDWESRSTQFIVKWQRTSQANASHAKNFSFRSEKLRSLSSLRTPPPQDQNVACNWSSLSQRCYQRQVLHFNDEFPCIIQEHNVKLENIYIADETGSTYFFFN